MEVYDTLANLFTAGSGHAEDEPAEGEPHRRRPRRAVLRRALPVPPQFRKRRRWRGRDVILGIRP